MRTLLIGLLLAAGLAAQDRYYTFHVDQDRLSGAPDFSFLNRPLTPADRIHVRGAHFHRVGADLKPNTADDERVRMFGVNLCFAGNFPAEADAPRLAKRLRRLGVNLVRLHHMDSRPDAVAEEANGILTTGPYPTLNPVSVKRLRSLLDAFRAEGIYVNVNLKVGYLFRPEVDKVPALPDSLEMPFQSKPLHMFYPRMVDLQVEFTRKLLDALRLKGDPVLAMVEINNESSMVEAWQRGQLQRFALGEYKAELDRQYQAYLQRPTRPKGFQEGDDYLWFLDDRDRHYLNRMLNAVRQSTDARVPVAGTQVGFGGLMILDSHSILDYQDNHFYIDHYNFPNARWDARDWRIRDSSSVGTGMAAFLNMAAAREAGRPYTISEYNQNWPNRHAAEIDPTFAAFSAFQDWDALMHFAYSHNRNWDGGIPSSFDLNGDWSKFVSFGQSAWLFRTGALQPGRKQIDIPVSSELRLRSAREKRISAVAPFLASAAGYDPAVALLHRVGLTRAEGAILPKEAQAPLPSPFRSDTGELYYDRDGRVFTIQAPQVAGVFGFIGTDRMVHAGSVGVRLSRESRGYVTLMVTSLDGKAVEYSNRLLLTLPGYILGSQPGSEPPRPQQLVPYGTEKDWWTLEKDPRFPDKPSGSRSATAPIWMERVESVVHLRTSAGQMTVYPLDGAGARMRPLGEDAVKKAEGGLTLHLQAPGQPAAPWYELVAAGYQP